MKKNGTTLINRLFNNPCNFSFTKAIDILLTKQGVNLNNFSNKDLQNIIITSAQNLQPKFCDIKKIVFDEVSEKPKIVTNLISFAGVEGLLNDEYFEKFILHQNQSTRRALFDFIDMLTNRILSSRYTFCKKHDLTCLSTKLHNSTIGKITLSLTGIDYFNNNKQKNIHEIQEQFRIAAQNFYWSYARSSEGLRCILSSFFNFPVYIEQFIGDFDCIDESQMSKIGLKNYAYNKLGIDSYIGNKTWNAMSGINVLVGPLNYNDYQTLLPKKSTYDEKTSALYKMKQIIRSYVPIDFKVKIYVFLDKVNVGYTTLNSDKRLNKNTFIMGKQKTYSTFFCENV